MLGSAASQAMRSSYIEALVGRDYTGEFNRRSGPIVTFQQEELHRILHSGSIEGKTLLEVGCGPMLWCSFLTSSRFNDIVLSELVEDCRLELEKWINKSEDASDWTFRAEQIAALEGYSDIRKGALEIQERTRFSIRKVIPCDILELGVLPPEHKETFDVVISCNCLEASTADHEFFRRVVGNVGTLVKDGGLLVLVGVGGTTSFSMGNTVIPQANVTEDVVKQAVADAGFQINVYSSKGIDGWGIPDLFAFVLEARKC